jgi:hypothetical protein
VSNTRFPQVLTLVYTILLLVVAAPIMAQPLPATEPVVGQVQRMEFEYASVSASDFQKLFRTKDAKSMAGNVPKGSRVIRIQFKSTVVKSVIKKTGDTWLFSYAMENPDLTLTVNDQPASEYARELVGGLSQPVYVKMALGGIIENLYFPKKTPRQARELYRLVLGHLQFVNRPDSNLQWGTTEMDANGQYITQYTDGANANLKRPADERVIRKSKVEYLPEPFRWLPRHGNTDKIIDTDFVQFFRFKAGALAQIDGTEKTSISVAGKVISYIEGIYKVTAQAPRQLTAGQLSKQDRDSGRRLKGARVEALWQSEQTEEDSSKIHEQQLGKRNMDDLVKEILAADVSPESRRKHRTQLYQSLQAAMYLYPKEVLKLRPFLMKGESGDMPFRIINGAISAVGNGEGQALVRRVLNQRRKNNEVAIQLVSTLSDVLEPDLASVELLTNIAQTTKEPLIQLSAELGLGTMALMLRFSAPERVQSVVRRLVNELKTAQDEERKIDMLRALGNAGATSAQPAIIPFLESTDPRTRSIAMAAIRWDPSKSADALLLGKLRIDVAKEVRLAAIEAYELRPMTPNAIVVHKIVALTDDVPNVRLGALNNLFRCRFRHPDVVDVVRISASDDSDEDIRKKAQELLEEAKDD